MNIILHLCNWVHKGEIIPLDVVYFHFQTAKECCIEELNLNYRKK